MLHQLHRMLLCGLLLLSWLAACSSPPPPIAEAPSQPLCDLLQQPTAIDFVQQASDFQNAGRLINQLYGVDVGLLRGDYADPATLTTRTWSWYTDAITYSTHYLGNRLLQVQSVLSEPYPLTMGSLLGCLGSPSYYFVEAPTDGSQGLLLIVLYPDQGQVVRLLAPDDAKLLAPDTPLHLLQISTVYPRDLTAVLRDAFWYSDPTPPSLDELYPWSAVTTASDTLLLPLTPSATDEGSQALCSLLQQAPATRLIQQAPAYQEASALISALYSLDTAPLALESRVWSWERGQIYYNAFYQEETLGHIYASFIRDYPLTMGEVLSCLGPPSHYFMEPTVHWGEVFYFVYPTQGQVLGFFTPVEAELSAPDMHLELSRIIMVQPGDLSSVFEDIPIRDRQALLDKAQPWPSLLVGAGTSLGEPTPGTTPQ